MIDFSVWERRICWAYHNPDYNPLEIPHNPESPTTDDDGEIVEYP